MPAENHCFCLRHRAGYSALAYTHAGQRLTTFDSPAVDLVSYYVSRAVVDSSWGDRSRCLGEGGRQGQFPEQRKLERVRPGNG